MKSSLLIIYLLLITSIIFSGEKIEKLEIFGKVQKLPDYCELKKNSAEGTIITCIPPDKSNIVGVEVDKSANCIKKILNHSENVNSNVSVLVNTNIKGIWYFESSWYHEKPKITLFERVISDGTVCLQVISGKSDALNTYTDALWF